MKASCKRNRPSKPWTMELPKPTRLYNKISNNIRGNACEYK
jgi:hypothetical protein